MLNLPAELRSIVLSYVPIATIASLFKISTLTSSVSREIHRRPAEAIVIRHSKYTTDHVNCRLEEITHFYGLYAFNAKKGLLYYFYPCMTFDISHLNVTNLIHCHVKTEGEKIVYDIIYLTNGDLYVTRGDADGITRIELLWRDVTSVCLSWGCDSAALLCKGEVYLIDDFSKVSVWNFIPVRNFVPVWSKIPVVIESPPREMQLWNVGSSQYLAVLDHNHILRIYHIVNSIPVDVIPDVATLLLYKKNGGYVDFNDKVFTWKRERKCNFDEIHLIPYHNTYLWFYRDETSSTCVHCSSLRTESKEDLEFRVTFDPVTDEEIYHMFPLG